MPMKTIIIPYGAEGWKWRQWFAEEVVASKTAPPFLYQDVLIIVPSSRMRRPYLKLFLDAAERIHRTSAIAPPDIVPLHNFIGRLCARMSAPRIIDEASRLVLLEGIVKNILSYDQSYSIPPDILASSLSSAVASMIEQLASACINPQTLASRLAGADYADRPAARILLEAYSMYADALERKGLSDPWTVLSYIAEKFDHSLLSGYSRIVLDGIHDASEAELKVIEKMTGVNCTLVLEAASDELIKHASRFHPLRSAKEFLSRIERLSPELGRSPDEDDLFIARSIFSDRPFAEIREEARVRSMSFKKRIFLLSGVNMREEVKLIAREVKKSLLSGVQPDTILVAFPSLDEYGGLVEEIFEDHGIPYNRALGRQLSSSQVVTSVVSMLRSLQEDFSGPSLMRIFGSPFLKFGATGLESVIDRLMRRHTITGKKERWFSAVAQDAADDGSVNDLGKALAELFHALAPFQTEKPAPLDEWTKRLSSLLSWSGIEERVLEIRGPLNMNLQAYKKFIETIARLAAAGRMFSEHVYTFDEFFFLLKKTLMHTRFQVPLEDEAGVQVMGIIESAGRPWNEIYLGGLTDGGFPQRIAQNIFLPETALELLGVRTSERARLESAYHFYRLLQSGEKVVLTMPESEAGRPAVPSPFISELMPLMDGGLINRGVTETSQLQFSLKIEDSMSITDLARALGRSLHAQKEPPSTVFEVINADIEGMQPLRRAVSMRPRGAEQMRPMTKKQYDVTELDLYLSCPYDYCVTMVLGLAPLEEVTEDISPLMRGVKVHAILKEFYKRWSGAVTEKNMDDARHLLHEIAEKTFKDMPETFRNIKERDAFFNIMAERFLEAEKEFWKQGMQPVILEEDLPGFEIRLSSGETVELNGRVDRIDVDKDGNFIVVDYKTGYYPEPMKGVEQKIFQLPVYAVMVRGLSAGIRHHPPLRRPIGLAYYDLSGKVSPLARDVVLFDREARDDHPSAKPVASSKSSQEFEAILEMSIDKARQAVEGIIAGDFRAEPAEESACRSCNISEVCGMETEKTI